MATNLDVLIADLQSYVVAPANAFGLGGFVFDAEGEAVATLTAEITDHYTEDNKALQDHIAIRPKRIVLKGYVGEIVSGNNGSTSSLIQQAVQKLTTLSSFLPTLSSVATQAINSINSSSVPDLTVNDAANLYGILRNLIPAAGNGPKQQQAYNYFKALMSQGILMAIQTPWEFMTSMAIESIHAVQSENSPYISDFSVTLKEIRIAKTINGAYTTNLSGQSSSPSNLSSSANQSSLQQFNNGAGGTTGVELQGVASLQAQPPVQIGNVAGVALPTASLPGWQSTITSSQDIVSSPAALSIFEYA